MSTSFLRPYYVMIECMMVLVDFNFPDHINPNNLDKPMFYNEIYEELVKQYGAIIPYEELFKCLKTARQVQNWKDASLAKAAKFRLELNKFYLTTNQRRMIDHFMEKEKWKNLDS